MHDRGPARREAVRLTAALDPDFRARLHSSPLEAVDGYEGVVLEWREEAEVVGRCSVAAGYSPGPPPRITIGRSRSRRRRAFSVLHELGHHLVGDDAHLAEEVFPDIEDAGAELEELICDGFAAEILLPDELVDQYLPDEGPAAADVVRLFEASGASREACCVRASQRLQGAGHVMLAHGRIAVFTATRGLKYRVARMTDQGEGHLVALAGEYGTARRETRVRYRTGNTSDLFFGDAVAHGNYVFAVLMAHRAPWQELNIFSRDPEPVRDHSTCRECDWEFEVWGQRCAKCGEPPCPTCRVCWCEPPALARRTCDTCFTSRLLSNFVVDATTCKDCA